MKPVHVVGQFLRNPPIALGSSLPTKKRGEFSKQIVFCSLRDLTKDWIVADEFRSLDTELGKPHMKLSSM